MLPTGLTNFSLQTDAGSKLPMLWSTAVASWTNHTYSG